MTKEQEKLKARFLEPEVRDGVEVTSELKDVWKVILDMFEEFARICDKYGLRYCMDGGSLLGAIRHKGFIPWDDDMDVSLFRDDFKKFLAVAPKELKYPYVMQYTTNDPNHFQAYACIRNAETTAIDSAWTDSGRIFCMGIGIDIFPIDYIPDDARKIRRLLWFNRQLIRLLSYASARKVKGLKKKAFKLVFSVLYKIIGVRRLVAVRDWNFSRYHEEDCRRCSNIAFNLGKERAIWDKAVYADRIKVPFEYLDVWVPVGYETYLSKVYGADWRTPMRGRGDHESLTLDVNRSYKAVLVEKFGYRPDYVAQLP